jgi:MYXO-CTERM domain-containing protein
VTTLVFDGTIPNFNVLGTIRGDSVQIIPSPGVMATVLAGVGLSASRRRRRLG